MNLKRIPFLLTLILALCACNLPANQSTPTSPSTDDAVATEVSKLLTVVPTNTIPGMPVITATQAGPAITAIPTQANTPTPAPTATSLPTNTPTTAPIVQPTFTPPASDPRTRLGAPTYQDTLDSDRAWSTDADSYTSLKVENGVMTLTAISDSDGWRLTWPEPQDFYFEMNVKTGTCSGSDHYGVIFRVPDKTVADRGYLYGYTCDGEYSLRKWDGKKMTNLIPWTANPAILAGSDASNRMGLLVTGQRIALYANGTLLGEAQDASYTQKGGIGLFIGQDETNGFSIQVDDLSYWDNPGL